MSVTVEELINFQSKKLTVSHLDITKVTYKGTFYVHSL